MIKVDNYLQNATCAFLHACMPGLMIQLQFSILRGSLKACAAICSGYVAVMQLLPLLCLAAPTAAVEGSHL